MPKLFTFLSVVSLLLPVGIAHGAINVLNSQSSSTQFFATTTNAHVSIKSSSGTHTFDWTGILQPTQGGTGLSSVSVGDLLYGSATNTLARLAATTTATRYLSNTGASGTPAWAQINLANGVTGTLSVQNGGTGASLSLVKGDVLVANNATTVARLAVGTDGQVLMASSTATTGVSWEYPAKHFQADTGGTLTSGLRAYYKLDDTSDFWGGNTLTNNHGTVAFSAGKVGNAADQGTSNTTKWLDASSTIGIDGETVSVALWVNVNTAPASSAQQQFAYQENNRTRVDNRITYWNNGGTFTVRYLRNGIGASAQTLDVVQTLTVGTWYHLVYTYDGSKIEGWINGVSQGTASAFGNGISNGSQGFSIGADVQNTNGEIASALIDEVGVWDKKLSNQEITDLYNGGSGQTMVR